MTTEHLPPAKGDVTLNYPRLELADLPMGRRAFVAVLAIVLSIGLLTSATLAEKRVALVIGNSGYEQVPALPNPKNDAEDIAAILARLDFEVQKSVDLSYSGMRKALLQFSNKVVGADIALVYFAGHGIEVNRENYLIPVDAALKSDVNVAFEAIALDQIMQAVQPAKRLRMVLLDACRDNPFVQTMRSVSGTRSVGRGLASVEPTVGTLVSYAAKEGTTADDGIGRNSPYTTALLSHLEEPGLELNFLFRKVRDRVLEATGGKQEPFTYGSLPGESIYLNKSTERPQLAQPSSDQYAVELAYWNAIKDSDQPAVLRSYIERFPDGVFVFLAETRLKQIEQPSGSARETEAEAEARRAREFADWEAIRFSNDPAALQAYLAKHPNGTFSDRARTRLEKALQLKYAAVDKEQTNASASVQFELASRPEDESLSERELALKVQQQLERLGCNPGRPDGIWGPKSRRALERYARHGKVELASLDPTSEVLEMLSERKARVCPLVCGPRHRAKDNRCVLKTCPNGRELSRSGTCIAKHKKPVVSQKRSSSQVSVPKQDASGKECGLCSAWTSNGYRMACGARYRSFKKKGQCK